MKHLSGSSSTLPKSPGIESVNSFDERVLQRNRETAKQDMDRLYAAVAAHEEARRSQQTITKAESRDSLRSTAADSIVTLPKAPNEGRKNLPCKYRKYHPERFPTGRSVHEVQAACTRKVYPRALTKPSTHLIHHQANLATQARIHQ